jgi:hypothetical protein
MAIRSKLVVVAFYQPKTDDTEPFFNRFVANVDRPYCHVELAFPVNSAGTTQEGLYDEHMESCCIFWGERAELVKKRFSRRNYRLLYVPVTPKQWSDMRARAAEIVAANAQFSRYSMLSTLVRVLPVLREARDPDATCCSIMTAQLLVHGGVLPGTVNPRRVTPSGLQKLLLEHTQMSSLCFGVSALQLKNLRCTSVGPTAVRS